MASDTFLAATFDLLEAAPEDELLIERRTTAAAVTLRPQRGTMSAIQIRRRLAALERWCAEIDAKGGNDDYSEPDPAAAEEAASEFSAGEARR
jgi:hypothetical protein